MEDIVTLARKLGSALQQDEDYINMRTAEQECEANDALSVLIEAYNTKRMKINVEASKTDRDDEKMQALNKEMREIYAAVMGHDSMKRYNSAKQVFEEKLNKVLGIINNSAMGEDPETTEPLSATAKCSGNCASCSGC